MVKVVSILKLALGLPAGCLRGRRKIRIIQEGCSAALLQRISRISAVFYLCPRFHRASIIALLRRKKLQTSVRKLLKLADMSAGARVKNALTPEQTSSSLKEQYTLPLAA
jgi:hypothetical protein